MDFSNYVHIWISQNISASDSDLISFLSNVVFEKAFHIRALLLSNNMCNEKCRISTWAKDATYECNYGDIPVNVCVCIFVFHLIVVRWVLFNI